MWRPKKESLAYIYHAFEFCSRLRFHNNGMMGRVMPMSELDHVAHESCTDKRLAIYNNQ